MFPTTRLRRLRHHPVVRDLVRETTLTVRDLILPLFVRPGRGIRSEIASMPGNYQLSVDRLVDEVGAARDAIERLLAGIIGRHDRIGRDRELLTQRQAFVLAEARGLEHRRVDTVWIGDNPLGRDAFLDELVTQDI